MRTAWRLKGKGREFFSSYERDRLNERIFVLTAGNRSRRITFESWQAAVKNGWVKQ